MMDWIQKHIAVICMMFGLLSAIFLMVSWGIGYYANALYGTHFELASVWQGISSVGIGLVGLFKWLVDSSPWNTNKGNNPYDK